MINTLALLFFPLLMAFAASSDLLTMRISNRVVLILVVGFLGLAVFINMPFQEVLLHFFAAFAVLLVGFVLFSFGWIGGGDAKLAAATSLWLGFAATLPYLVYAALLGGVLTLLILAMRRIPLPGLLKRVDWVARLHSHKNGVPYGVALASAGLLVYSDTAIFHQLAG